MCRESYPAASCRLGDGSEGANMRRQAVDGNRFLEVERQEDAVVVVAGEDDHPIMEHVVAGFLWLVPADES